MPTGRTREEAIPPWVSTVNEVKRKQHTDPYPVKSKRSKSAKPKCWRIQSVPREWTASQLIRSLQEVDDSLGSLSNHEEWLMLYPSCFGFAENSTQTALLDLKENLEYFEYLDTERKTIVIVPSGVHLSIDCSFYDLTPLNRVPDGETILADIVAVTGLAGHAFGSWKSRHSHKMWLRDFLPRHFPTARIMTYGYKSNIVGETSSDTQNALDYTRGLIHALQNARRSDKERERPLIFIGHSMGGIVIMQTLLLSKSNPDYADILEATRALFLFGTPHQGTDIVNLQEMLSDKSSARKELIEQLRQGSIFLDQQREAFSNLWYSSRNTMNLYSFYETEMSETVQQTPSGNWERGGKKSEAVKKASAMLFVPGEKRIPIHDTHTEMVKFSSSDDAPYHSVVTHMSKTLEAISKELEGRRKEVDQGLRAMVDECLKSLNASTSGCLTRRDELLAKRHPNTCEWFFADERYQNWIAGDDRPLWIPGPPGSGKSVLSAILTDQIANEWSRGSNVVYFFCKGTDERLRTDSAILKHLLAQILDQTPSCHDHFVREPDYRKNKANTTWDSGMLWRVFQSVCTSDNVGNLVIVVDAIDECEEKPRKDLLGRLRLLLENPKFNKNIKIIVTGRPEVSLKDELRDVLEVPLRPSSTSKDIEAFVANEAHKLSNTRGFARLEKEIYDRLVDGANGMFLWVSLIIDDLNNTKHTTREAIRRKLRELPKGVEELYARILGRIEREDNEKARKILQFVVYTKRPMSLEELAIAIAVDPEHESVEDMEDNKELDLKGLLSAIFGSLIIIGEDGIVNLVHQTAKDFLSGTNLSGSPSPVPYRDLLSDFCLSEGDTYTALAISCMSYLCLDAFEVGPYTEDMKHTYSLSSSEDYFEDLVQKYHFLNYAALHWGDYSKSVENLGEKDPTFSTTIKKVAKAERKIQLADQIYHGMRTTSQVSEPLEIAAFFGIRSLVQELLNNGANVNSKGLVYGSALIVAAEYGHQDTVQLLLDLGADVNPKEGTGRSALTAAAWYGHQNIVQLLLDRGADVNPKESTGRSALTSAAWSGHQNIVQLLLDRGADVNPKEDDGRSALTSAAWSGHQNIVQLLLDRGADVNPKEGTGSSALTAAAWSGHQNIVQLLLDLGADTNFKEDVGRSALTAAARCGHQNIVQLLLDRGADINPKDGHGSSALTEAASSGHQNIVQLLLDRGADVTTADINHALRRAKYYGFHATVQLIENRRAEIRGQTDRERVG